MEKIDAGKFVKYSYILSNADNGEELFSAPKDQPDELIYGISQEVVPGLLAALKGLSVGDKFEVTLPPAAAFGPRSEEHVIELEKDIFMRDGKLAEEVKVGADLPMMTAEGYRVLGRILEVGDKVKMDFNHPFAGMTVTFKGEVEEVRDATPEELTPTGGCCCGGCGDHDHGDHGCGDGCGSGCGSGCC